MNYTDPQDAAGIVYGIGWSFMFISIICSTYIVCRVSLRWRKVGALPLTLRFPFYIALTDIFLAIVELTDQIHDVLYGSNWDGVMCKIAATLVGIAVFTNMSLILCISMATYFSVVLERNLNFGKHDWKLFVYVLSFSTLMSLAGLPSAGPSRYCYAPDKSLSIMGLCIEFTIFIAVFFFSSQVYLKIRTIMEHTKILDQCNSINDSSISSPHEKPVKGKSIYTRYSESTKSTRHSIFTKMSKTASRKVLSYILNYFIQWTSAVPTTIGNLFDYYPNWTAVLCDMGMNWYVELILVAAC
ncbi:hypothetical protein HDV06_000673 [Boothiomyces sp. JEL0866]|nr:hypothetical protein HDV06_000673 [Boothiomyces sp. JEL0866]